MKYWPFSLSGSCLAGFSLYLLGTSVPRGQGYGIFLSLLFLCYLTGSLIRTGAGAFRFEREHFEWKAYWNYASSPDKRKNMLLQAPSEAGWGTRYLFLLRGNLSAGKDTLYTVRTSRIFTQRLLFGLPLPLPGLFQCRGRLYLTDLFGFIRFPLTDTEHRQVLYHPALLGNRTFPTPRAADENEEQIKSDPSNPEKVLMREYQPGDLVRDINWKASGKFSTIYTRISPDREQTVSRMTLVLRNEGTADIAEPAASVLLFGLKSLGETLIHDLRKANPALVLEVYVNDKVFDSRSEDFEQDCLSALCRLGKKSSSRGEIPEGAILCTTEADRDAGILRAQFPERVFICTLNGEGEKDRNIELLNGNPLPRGSLLKALLIPGRTENKVSKALGSRKIQEGAINLGVRL